MRRSAGFTLIEILAVVAVIAVLGGVAYSGSMAVIEKGHQARETSAARKLIAGYMTAAAENDGILLPGYDKTADSVELRDGSSVHGEAAHRYTWRVMPYLDGSLRDALYVSNNRTLVDATSEYVMSLYPSFGMNMAFVGGVFDGETEKAMKSDTITRLGQAAYPSKLLVFATARGKGTGKQDIQGYFRLTPPNVATSVWSASENEEYDESTSPDHYGHLDMRYDKHAICAFLDGHVALMEVGTLSDMRFWSAKAAEEDNPSYTVKRPSSGSGGPRGRY